jgi:hypothetical protein
MDDLAWEVIKQQIERRPDPGAKKPGQKCCTRNEQGFKGIPAEWE